MSFVVTLALLIAGLAAAPVVAHLLRRSRAEPRLFPPTRLVPKAHPVAHQRSRLEDRALLLIRALMIALLALLGATPLVRCSRLSIARESGGSVALAIVLDDSLSMRARTASGSTRWARALDGAQELAKAAREGDAIAIVLAGAPARLAVAATTDLGLVRRALGQLRPSDRATDLEAAVQLSRSALQQLPHTDRRILLLSDLAGAAVVSEEPPLWAPLSELREPAGDCGVLSAESRGRQVSAVVACSSIDAARGRSLEFVATSPSRATDAGRAAEQGSVIGTVRLEPTAGEQTLVVDSIVGLGLDARLTGKDAIEEDDVCPVAPPASDLSIGLIADSVSSRATTGGPTLVEQAMEALALDFAVKPLASLPDDAQDLAQFAALILDDPGALAPEARLALTAWIERGGVAVAWLGPRAESGQLGANLEPFLRGAARWETSLAKGIEPTSLAWLGAPATSLADIRAQGRARLEGVLSEGATVRARWDDGQPWMAERDLGRGMVVTLGLPSSIETSDVALRPAFLALLDHVVQQAARRRGSRRGTVGTVWAFPDVSRVEVTGPQGALELREGFGANMKAVVVDLLGRYTVQNDGSTETRIAAIEAREVLTLPREPEPTRDAIRTGGITSQVDGSPEIALGLLTLLAAELLLRTIRRFRRVRERRRDGLTPQTPG